MQRKSRIEGGPQWALVCRVLRLLPWVLLAVLIVYACFVTVTDPMTDPITARLYDLVWATAES